MEGFDTPILFLIFNRPDLTEIVFKRVREVRPKHLFIAADGPRVTHSEDLEKCKKTREVVLNLIDWDCKVKTLFRNENLGCGIAVSEAITWFFNHVRSGIILEDDILPEISFFKFSEEMLIRYEKIQKVMGITGLNWQNEKIRGEGSYYFSSYPGTWGWATWADRWKKFKFVPDFRENDTKIINTLNRISRHGKIRRYHLNDFANNIGKKDVWDVSWKYCVFQNEGIIVTPQRNLNSNLGFSSGSTHTTTLDSHLSYRKTYSLAFPLIHPREIKVSRKADDFMMNRFLGRDKRSFLKKVLDKLIW